VTTPTYPIRTHRFELDGDWSGFWILVRTNPPMRVYEDLVAARKISDAYAALAEMTLSSNLTDEHGESVDLTQPAGWRAMPLEFIEEAAALIKKATEVPKASGNGSPQRSSPELESSPSTTS
jgi:hypothetical protein